MRREKRTVLSLAAALLLCVAATAGLLLIGRDAPEDPAEALYYFTNYRSPAQLAAASVENETGSVVLAQANGTYYATTGAVSGSDDEAVAAFFEAACQIPLSQVVEGASAADEQYGLTTPRAEITLQDIEGGGLVFRLGNEAPGGAGVYTCLAGDERVFILEAGRAAPFLSSIYAFLDLTLYPTLDGEAVKALSEIEVYRSGALIYRLRQAAANEDGSTVYFSMVQPWRLLLGVDPAKTGILTPLRELEGVSVSALTPEESGLAETQDKFRLTFRDEGSVTVLVGSRTAETTLVMAEGSDRVLCVPTASLAFLDADAHEIIGKNLISLNLNDLRTLTLNDRTYAVAAENGTVSVRRDGETYDAAAFQNTVFAALSRITIQGRYTEARSPETELLHIRIETQIETIDLRFYPLDGRKCAVAIDGQMAVWCDLAAVSALLQAAA